MSKYVGFRLGKVHESHVISDYYCGGCGWPVTDHDSFCPECGGAFRECDASNLEAENAKLRQENQSIGMAAYALGRASLADENAKLRELAVGLHKCWANESCEDCPMQDDDGWCVRDIRLRELGVEVD